MNKAGRILKNGLKKNKNVRLKGKQQYLTDYDIKLENLLVSAIKKLFPTHSINGEETGYHKGSSDYCWYIDPVSNTRNFIHGLAGFAIGVGLTKGNKPIFGSVYDPMLDEVFTAEKGKGAFCNWEKISVSKVDVLEHSFMNIDWQKRKTEKEIDEGVKIFTSLGRTCTIRAIGSVALMISYVAAGRMEAMVNNYFDKHAVIPASIILEEAGGSIKDLHGKKWSFDSTSTVASNGYIDKLLFEQLNWYSSK